MAKHTEQENNTINLIGLGTDIKGNVESTGNIRIDGSIIGDLITKGKLVIGATGFIKGKVVCKNSDVEGKIEGQIYVEELLSLKSTASIMGDMSTKKLAIEPGAKFTGNCNMTSNDLGMNTKKKDIVIEEKAK